MDFCIVLVIGSSSNKAWYDVMVFEVEKNKPFSSISLVGGDVFVIVGGDVTGARVGADWIGDDVDLVGVRVGEVVSGGLSPGRHWRYHSFPVQTAG